jgi:hypothetical protein
MYRVKKLGPRIYVSGIRSANKCGLFKIFKYSINKVTRYSFTEMPRLSELPVDVLLDIFISMLRSFCIQWTLVIYLILSIKISAMAANCGLGKEERRGYRNQRCALSEGTISNLFVFRLKRIQIRSSTRGD